MPAIKELKEKRASLITESRTLVEKADSAEGLSAEDRAADDKIWSDIKQLDDQIKQAESDLDRLKRSREAEADLARSNGRRSAPDDAEDRSRKTTEEVDESALRVRQRSGYRSAFTKFLRGERLSADEQTMLESRDGLTSGSQTQAGYFVMSEAMAGDFIKNVDDILWIRQLARKERLTEARSLGVLRRTTKASTFAWAQELSTPTVDTAYAIGKRALEPHYMTGEMKVSRDLLRFSTRNIESIITEEMAVNAAEVQEDAFLTGTGVQCPLGLFVASNDGISTSRDVSTDNSTTAITADGLINAKFALKSQYRNSPSISWLFHRDAIKMISKLKDGEGRYLLEYSLREGVPDQLLGLAMRESERAPNTFTAGLYVGLLGDFSWYWIVDALDIEMQRLTELYARSNQDGFIARAKLDAAPMLEEAFVRVTLAP